MNRSRAWITCWFGGCLLAWSGCAWWPGASSAPDLSQAGGSRLEMATMSERLGRADLAEKFYRDVLAQQPGNQVAHHRLGALAAHDGRWQEADEHFCQARRAAPPSADLLTDIAYAHYERHQMRAAEQTLREALELEPEHAKSRSLLALVLGEQGRFREGLAEFRQAVRGIEDHGGAGESYGASVAAGASPTPPESTRRTQVQLAAAGVRGKPNADPSSPDAGESAGQERLIADNTAKRPMTLLADDPLRITGRPAISPTPVADVGSPIRQPRTGPPASTRQNQLVASSILTNSPANPLPRPLPNSSMPVRLPPPPDLAQQRRPQGQAGGDQSVIVRIDPSGPSAHLPGVAPAGPTKDLPAATAENHRRIRSVEPPPPSKVYLRDGKKDESAVAASAGKAAEAASKASPGDRSALAARSKNTDSKNTKPIAGDEYRAASVAPTKQTKLAADPAVPAAPRAPSLAAPQTAEIAAEAKLTSADRRASRRAGSTARPDYGDAETLAAPLARKTSQKAPAREAATHDAAGDSPSEPERAARPPLGRSAAQGRPATLPASTSAAPDDWGVLSRSKSHGTSQRTESSALTTTPDKGKSADVIADADATRPAAGAKLVRKTKLASYESPTEASAINKSTAEPKPLSKSDPPPAATEAPPAAKAARPVPVTPAMSLPVGLEFSLPKGNAALPSAK